MKIQFFIENVVEFWVIDNNLYIVMIRIGELECWIVIFW